MSPEGLEKTKLTRFKKGNIPAIKLDPEISKKAWNTRRQNKIKNLENQESKKTIHNL